ncbi:HAD domain-containing protein [Dyella humicola]|uniref:HAD domain-containing protein n=1 Tax=Dyella humicola TaxID=2992126 RepID=UPI0022522B37|nr:HAD domain-containing protein [Dyella humicola]
MILYLDFDGVLHHDDVRLDLHNRPYLRGSGTLFEYADRLTQVLAPYPQVKIVLSTSWVRVKRFSYAVGRLPVELRQRVIGATWHSRFMLDDELLDWWLNTATRYEQIIRDVRRRQPQQWLALDDDAEGWPDSASAHLVCCDSRLGLSESRVCRELEGRLAEFHRIGITGEGGTMQATGVGRPHCAKALTTKNRARVAAMTAKAKYAARNGTRWFSSSELLAQAKLQGLLTIPTPSEWTTHRRMFAIDLDGEPRFPAYGLDPLTFEPFPAMAAILDILEGRDAWFLAVWFESVNSYLGGVCPREVLAQDPIRVISAAQNEAAGIIHG